MKIKPFCLRLLVAGCFFTSILANAETWTNAYPGTYWLGVSVSANGCKLAATTSLEISVVSVDGGNSWQTNPTPPDCWDQITSSADGNKLAATKFMPHATGALVYISTNNGNAWTATASPSSQNWSALVSSGTGDILAASINPGYIYVTTNSGVTWTNGGSLDKRWTSLACSTDGKKLAATAYGDNIYISTNLGNTWTPTTTSNDNWAAIACSADGTRLIASGDATYATYISTNSGLDWMPATPYKGSAVASSADGSKLAVANSQGSTYISNDSGVTWTVDSNSPTSWYCIALSADGSELVAAGNYVFAGGSTGGIWIRRTTPSPQLIIQAANTDALLSWLVPSSNFALQQSYSLGLENWITLTNAPSFDLVTLQNQISFSNSNTAGSFFRLISQ